MQTGISLVSLALGYLVFASASKEKKDLKVMGRIIGIVVIICSIAGLVCDVSRCVGKDAKKCAISKMNCPVSPKTNCPTSGPSAN